MYNNIVKIAKNIIAKNQAKKLLDYFIREAPNGLTEDQKQLIKQKIQYVQKNSFNFVWFVHRFIAENKHYQDIQPLLKLTKAYSKLNKQLKTFQFNDENSFSKFQQFMDKYIKGNIKNNQFKKPTYCSLIYSDNNYNYYYADAKDEKCYQDLHKCNTKADGKQYAMWCVVTGTMKWGRYTDSQFPFYVYVTDKKNTPFILFNFGYDSNSQIKDIHDNAFTKYTEQITNSIMEIAKKYNFDMQESESIDFELLSQTIKLQNKNKIEQLIENNKPIVQNNKYAQYYGTGSTLTWYCIIDKYKKQLSYIFHAENQMAFNNHSFNDQELWKLLLKNDDVYNATNIILYNSNISQKTMNFVLTWYFKNDQVDAVQYLVKAKKIKNIDENQIQLLLNFDSYKILALLINNNYINIIQNNKLLDAFTTQPIAVDGLTKLIQNGIIKWNDNLLQLFIKSQKFYLLTNLIVKKKIQFSDKILDILINNNKPLQLQDILLSNRYINHNQKIIQFFINNKYLTLLNDINDKFHNPTDAELFQKIFVENDDLENLKHILYHRQSKLDNNTLDYLLNHKQLEYLFNSLIAFNDIDKKIKDVNYFVETMIKNKYCSVLFECIKYNNLECTNNIIELFLTQKKESIIFQLIQKNIIEINDNIIDKMVKNNLFSLLIKLFDECYLNKNDNKQILTFLKENENKLSPIAKLRLNKYIDSDKQLEN